MTNTSFDIENDIQNNSYRVAFDAAMSKLSSDMSASYFISKYAGNGIKAVDWGMVDENGNAIDIGKEVGAYGEDSYLSSIGADHHSVYQSGNQKYDILMINSSSPLNGYGFNGQSFGEDESRLIFHEIAHAVTLQSSRAQNWTDIVGNQKISQAEELAIFCENLYYPGKTPQYRLGHESLGPQDPAPVGGVVGVELFSAYSAPPDVSTTLASNTYEALDSSNGVETTKIFYAPGGDAKRSMDHFIVDTVSFYGSNPLVVNVDTPNAGVSSLSANGHQFVSSMIGDLMMPSTAGAATTMLNTALKDVAAATSFTGVTYQHSYASLSGIDAQRFVDGVPGNFVDLAGPTAYGTLVAASTLEIDADPQNGSILLGGSGFVGQDWSYGGNVITHAAHDFSSSTDLLQGGAGSDVMVAGTGARSGQFNVLDGSGGDDILMGNANADDLKGGDDDDILIGSAGSDLLEGGDGNDTAYYGNATSPISASATTVVKSNGIDTLSGIESIVGTTGADSFTGSGQNMSFYGGAGNDYYYASSGPDRFIDQYTFNAVNSDTIDFSHVKSGVDLTVGSSRLNGTTTGGVYFEGIGIIHGSAGVDTFHLDNAGGGSRSVYGGDGADVFYVGNGVKHSYGEGGSDVFVVDQYIDNQTIDGGTDGDGSDVDLLDFSAFPVAVTITMTSPLAGTFNGKNGNPNTFTNIEKIFYGATAMNITGTGGPDALQSGSTTSYINGQGGDDVITVTAADSYTPANQTYTSVSVVGGAGNDVIHAYRASTIDGGADNDTIYGSDQADMIRGGAGNDTINAGGGNDVFTEQPNGVDHVDAGDGVDTYYSASRLTDFDFSLTGNDLQEFDIRPTGGDGTNMTMFRNLENASFYASSTSNEKISVSDAIAVLQQDADHYMTGTELRAALLARNAASGGSTRTAMQSHASSYGTQDVATHGADDATPAYGEAISLVPHDAILDLYGDAFWLALESGLVGSPDASETPVMHLAADHAVAPMHEMVM